MPVLSYSIKENWDADITDQVYYGEENNTLENLGNAVFFRYNISLLNFHKE